MARRSMALPVLKGTVERFTYVQPKNDRDTNYKVPVKDIWTSDTSRPKCVLFLYYSHECGGIMLVPKHHERSVHCGTVSSNNSDMYFL